jgi:tetratricopeptide (TPR) repeat protein
VAIVIENLWRYIRRPSIITRADHSMRASQWVIAARLYRKALHRSPAQPAIWVQYGHALKESGKITLAEAAYRMAFAYEPGNADAYLHLGHVLKIQGKKDEAQGAYLHAVAIDPSFSDAGNALAELGWSAGRLAELQRWAAARSSIAVERELEASADQSQPPIPDPIGGVEQDISKVEQDVSKYENVELLVQNVYRGVLKRDAEPAGISLYSNALRRGMLLSNLIAELIRTPEFLTNITSAPGSGGAAELRQLAAAMDRAMLTLAIGAAGQSRAGWAPDAPPSIAAIQLTGLAAGNADIGPAAAAAEAEPLASTDTRFVREASAHRSESLP